MIQLNSSCRSLAAALAAAVSFGIGAVQAQAVPDIGTPPAVTAGLIQGLQPSALTRGTDPILTVMIEMQGKAGGEVYSQSIKSAVAQAGASSFSSMAPAGRQAASQAAFGFAKSQAAANEKAQLAILPTVTRIAPSGRIVFRTKNAYNGISVQVPRSQLDALRALPGVKDVHVQIPKFQTAPTDLDFLGARAGAWDNPTGVLGDGIKVGIIDSGLDYIHTNFGGPGTPAAYSQVTDTNAGGHFPNAKVPGGYDFAGDAYTAASSGAGSVPVPDGNPMDSSNGHGTACASLIGGLGVTTTGDTYTGAYTSTLDMSALNISPGYAPNALLYPLRVFGVTGSTNLVVEALEWAMDPNGDNDMSDHLDVISMSLGANSGSYTDPDAVAASTAAGVGIMVVSAAGNAGDSYFIVSAPSVANNTLSIAASFNDTGGYVYDSSVTVTAGAGISGANYASLYGSPSPVAAPPISGNIVLASPLTGSTDGTTAVANLANAVDIAGNICMIDRGGISFLAKVDLCERAGAIATIVNQSSAGSGTPYPILMSLTAPPSHSKPAVMIGLNEANAVKTALGSGAVTVTIGSDNGFFNAPSAATPDTVASYSARGPRIGDNMLKPDLTAPAEVVAVATSLSGNKLEGFNGTSSATPHVSGIMALMKQLHPAWTIEELMALVMSTANHDLTTLPAGSVKYGAGRVGAGRIDAAKAAAATVIAYNATDAGLVSVSFGIVEVPAAGTASLAKNITLSNKGGSDITYTVSYADTSPVTGTTFSVGTGSSVTVPAGSTASVPVQFDADGAALLHSREASVATQLPVGTPRQYLTEKTGYAVFTPTSGTSPTLRVALYAAPKPVSSTHSTVAEVAPTTPSGNFTVTLQGDGVFNLSSALPVGVASLVKPYELQYASSEIGSPSEPDDPNVIKYVGVTSDYLQRSSVMTNTIVSFALEAFGTASTPDYFSSDKEIYIDSNNDGNFDYAIYLSSVVNGTANSNGYTPVIVNLHTNGAISRYYTNFLTGSSIDTNIFATNVLLVPALASDIGLTTGASRFTYQVVTYDRAGDVSDVTPPATYSVEKAGLQVQSPSSVGTNAQYYVDGDGQTFSMAFNGVNYQINDSLGLYLVHMHGATGEQGEVVDFTSSIGNLFWRHHDDFNYRWVMNVDKATNIGLPNVMGAGWVMAGLGDIDGDGKQDMIWYYQPNGVVYAWLMSGSGIKEGGVVSLGGVGPGWTIETVADLNGDGVADILWHHSSGVLYAWYMNPDATVASVQSLGAIDPASWVLVGTGKFDANAPADLVWTYEVPGPYFGSSYAWLMGTSSVSAVASMGANGSKSLVKVGDFDGDGNSDLLWRDEATGANEIWYMNGTSVAAVQPVPMVPAGYEAAAAVDFNSDGKVDLLWQLPSTGALTQWLMQGRVTTPTVNDLGTVGAGWFLPGQ